MSEQEQALQTIKKLIRTVRKNASPLGAITAARVEMVLESHESEILNQAELDSLPEGSEHVPA